MRRAQKAHSVGGQAFRQLCLTAPLTAGARSTSRPLLEDQQRAPLPLLLLAALRLVALSPSQSSTLHQELCSAQHVHRPASPQRQLPAPRLKLTRFAPTSPSTCGNRAYRLKDGASACNSCYWRSYMLRCVVWSTRPSRRACAELSTDRAVRACSTTGKTTLAKALAKVIPKARCCFQDDFAPPAEKVPMHPVHLVQDWDDPDGA